MRDMTLVEGEVYQRPGQSIAFKEAAPGLPLKKEFKPIPASLRTHTPDNVTVHRQ